MRTSESWDTSNSVILVPLLNPKFATGLAAMLCELRVRGTRLDLWRTLPVARDLSETRPQKRAGGQPDLRPPATTRGGATSATSGRVIENTASTTAYWS